MPNTDNFTYYIVISLLLGVVFIIAQVSMQGLNPTGSPIFIDDAGTPICDLISGGCGNFNATPDTAGTLGYLPSSSSSISATTGNVFTDSFTVIKEWIITPGGYILKTLSFPYTVTLAVFNMFDAPPGMAALFAVLISTFWYGIGLFFIINWLAGR